MMTKQDEKKPYSGTERRTDSCPICHCKREDLANHRAELKTRLPIWVFTTFLVFLGSILSYMNWLGWNLNAEAIRHNEVILIALNEHIDASNQIIREGSKILIELGVNQRKMMKRLELEFEKIPDYQLDIQRKK